MCKVFMIKKSFDFFKRLQKFFENNKFVDLQRKSHLVDLVFPSKSFFSSALIVKIVRIDARECVRKVTLGHQAIDIRSGEQTLFVGHITVLSRYYHKLVR